MTRLVLLAVLLLTLPTIARAQTPHPCDATPVANPTIQGTAKVGFCFTGKDVDGGTITSPLVFKVYVDADTTPTFTGTLTPAGAANTAGYAYYETGTAVNLPKGAHAIKVTVSTGTVEGLPSLPFTYTGVVAPPGTAVILRLVK